MQPRGVSFDFGKSMLLCSHIMTLGASLTAGSHDLGGRNFYVVLPSGTSAKSPVLIALHGNGGRGEPAARSVANGNSNIASTHIIVGPDGPSKSWNIKGDASKEDDQLYIGKTLLDHLATFDNVDPSSFKLYGFSNGAALTNRILIENDDARITHGITDGSQLNTFQYRPNTNGAFYVGGASNAYSTVKSTLTSRRVLQLVGGVDKVIPAAGGASTIPDGDGGKLQMVPWEDSAFAYAVAFGATGGKASLSPDSADEAKASYLNGQVNSERAHLCLLCQSAVGVRTRPMKVAPSACAALSKSPHHPLPPCLPPRSPTFEPRVPAPPPWPLPPHPNRTQVVAYNLKAVAHVAGPSEALAKAAVDAFLATTGALSQSASGGASTPSSPSSPSAPSAPSGPACTASCATEFDKCVVYGTNTYASCRAEIEAGTGPLKNKGCVAGCADTLSMAAHNPNPPAATGLSGGAVAGIVAGGTVALLIAAAGLAYWLRIRGQGAQPPASKELKSMNAA